MFETSNRGKQLSWKSVYNVLSGNKVFEGHQRSLLHMNYNNETSELAWLANVAVEAAPIITMNPTLPSLKSAASSAQRQTVPKPASTSSKSQRRRKISSQSRKSSSKVSSQTHKKISSAKQKDVNVGQTIVPVARALPKKKFVIKRNDANSFEIRKCDFCGLFPTNHYCSGPRPGSMICMQGNESHEVCGMVSCMMCREKWGPAENFAN